MKVRLDDIEMNITDEGQGMAVILLHGYPLNRTMWDQQVAALANEYRMIAPDLRGHGESDAPEGVYAMGLHADDVRELMDHLQLDRAVLVGFSMGGYATLAFQQKYADRLLGLVFADTRAGADSPEGRKGREDAANKVLSEGTAGVIEGLIPRLLAPATVERRGDIVERLRAIMASTPPAGFVGDLRGMAERPDSTSRLAESKCPTMVIVGEHDAVTPPADAEILATGIAGAEKVVIPGAGHMSPMENPDAFNDALGRFLRSLS